MMMYDVIIIGAGPAGSLTANQCAKAGLHTLLIDKDRFPREKPCAGGLSIRSVKALRLAGIQVPRDLIERTIFRAELMGPDMIPFHIQTPRPFGYIVRRGRFDAHLVEQAKRAGTHFIDDCELTKFAIRSDSVTCLTTQGAFKGKLLVGADGAATKVGRLAGLQKPMKANEVGIALEVNAQVPENAWHAILDPSMIYLWFLDIPFGYFWAFPRKHSLSLGIGGMATGFDNVPALLRGFAQLFRKRLGLPPLVLEKIRGHMLPVFALKLTAFTGHRVLLVGDAAGFVDTFTGQGICYALESGIIAGHIIKKIVQVDQNQSIALAQYTQLVHRRFGRELLYSAQFAQLVHAHRYGAFRTTRHLRSISEFIFDLAAGNVSYDRMRRNPLMFLGRCVVRELRSRFSSLC
ncbi:MAG: geranylgeranyl reductase family protein [Candidatus Hodarchaeota archaeon]